MRGPRLKKRCQIEVKLPWHNFVREKSNWFRPKEKKRAQKERSHDLKNQKMQATVQLKDSIFFK
jgi:hypothetical protein